MESEVEVAVVQPRTGDEDLVVLESSSLGQITNLQVISALLILLLPIIVMRLLSFVKFGLAASLCRRRNQA